MIWKLKKLSYSRIKRKEQAHLACSFCLRLTVSMTASTSSSFCFVGQFSRLILAITDSACTVATRRASSSLPASVLGECTITWIGADFRIRCHLYSKGPFCVLYLYAYEVAGLLVLRNWVENIHIPPSYRAMEKSV